MEKTGRYVCATTVYAVFIVFGLYTGLTLGRWSGYEWTRPVEVTQEDHPVKDRLFNEVRVFCWIPIQPSVFTTRARAVAETWGLLCNRIMFVSNTSDDRLPVLVVKLNEARDELWKKTQETFTWIYNNVLDEFDWFLKADADTYMHMHNLRKLLQKYSPYDDVALGHQFHVLGTYHSGGAGYVLSKEAVRRLVNEGFSKIGVCKRPNPFEDVFIGKCLNELNITLVDGVDENGAYRFHAIGVFDFLNARVPNWMHSRSQTKIKDSFACCSPHFISMHYASPEMLYTLDYLIHHLRPYGVQY